MALMMMLSDQIEHFFSRISGGIATSAGDSAADYFPVWCAGSISSACNDQGPRINDDITHILLLCLCCQVNLWYPFNHFKVRGFMHY